MSWVVMGDPHGEYKYFERAASFSNEVIVLGDVGINYDVYFDQSVSKFREMAYSIRLKGKISTELKDTIFFCIHGNHKARADTVYGYKEIDFHGAKALIQDKYPNIIFGIDGEIYTFNDKEYLVIGGAYSVDKWYRLKQTQRGIPGYNWFEDEQPSTLIKEKVEKKLEENNWKVHGILSHTCPYKYIPRELFLSSINQNTVDNSTEEWLDTIEDKLEYTKWYFGHFHGYKKIDKMIMLFHEIEELK